MKCIFIYNPNSGKGKILKKIEYIKNQLQKKYDVVDIHSTVSREDLLETAKKSCYKYLQFITNYYKLLQFQS